MVWVVTVINLGGGGCRNPITY